MPRTHELRKRLPSAAAAAMLALAVPAADAQLAWTPQSPPASPAARWSHAMHLIHPSYEVLLFGGRDGAKAFGDTWRWNGSTWTRVATSGPAPRHDHAMAPYYFEDDSAFLFGGRDEAGNVLGDTWIWGGAAWSPVATTVAPSARAGHAVVRDEFQIRTLYLFGGRTDQGLSDETWRFQDGKWQPIVTAVAPPAREGACLVEEDGTQRFFLFGGRDDTQVFSDAWVFDGAQWAQVDPLPHAVADGTAVYENLWRRRIMAFGGVDANATVNATFERIVDGWGVHQPANPPALRSDAALAVAFGFDKANYVLFGGRDAAGNALGDTQVLAPTVAPTVDLVGVGCGPGVWGSNSGPDVFVSNPVLLGSDVRVNAFTPSAARGFLFVGAEMSPLPQVHCGLAVIPAQVLPAPSKAFAVGVAISEVDISLPFVPALAGVPISAQLSLFERTAPNGVSFSKVIRLTPAL